MKTTILRRWLAGAAAAAAMLAGSGCAVFLVGAGAAIGAGTLAYVRGELRAAESVPYDRACNATTEALSDLKLKLISIDRDELSAKIIARTADDRRIELRIRRQGEKETAFYIRVGSFGDETLSRAIYGKIKSHL